MRVLVTNDDGIAAPGLRALALSMEAEGLDVVVVAPREDRSGTGAGFGPVHLGTAVEYDEVRLEGLTASAYAIDGLPALAVLAARLGAFGAPPDLVVSGINPGPNTGRSVLHSGTVGAALTAANLGVRGLAVSIDTGDDIHWATAGTLARAAVGWLASAPPTSVVNLNVPNRPLAGVRGVRPARLAPFGTVRTAVVESQGGKLQLELRATDVELDPDTDTALVQAGYAAVTALRGITVSDSVDAGELASAVAGPLSRAAGGVP